MSEVYTRPDQPRLYYNGSGEAGSATTWTLVPNVGPLNIDPNPDELSGTVRGQRHKRTGYGHYDLTLEFGITAAKDSSTGAPNTVLQALIDAANNDTNIGFAVKDDVIANVGAQGWEFVGRLKCVPDYPEDGDYVTYNFTAKPAPGSAVSDPVWRRTTA